MRKSETITELSLALSKAQSELKPLDKNASNPYFKSNYADLNESVDKILPVFTKYGLSIVQGGRLENGAWVIETMLIHSKGEWVSFDWPVIVSKDKPGPQDFASSSSYARRYGLQAIACAAAHDDDANQSQGVKVEVKPTPLKEAKVRAPSAPVTKIVNHADEISFEPDPRVQALMEYEITFGKNTGKKIKDIGLKTAQEYAAWLKESAKKDGRSTRDDVQRFIDNVEKITLSGIKQALPNFKMEVKHESAP